jgi:hypothetical protein
MASGWAPAGFKPRFLGVGDHVVMDPLEVLEKLAALVPA